MIKKVLAFLLCLTLIVGMSTSGFAMAMSLSTTAESDESKVITSVTAAGDTLYLLMMDGQVFSRPASKDERTALGKVRNTQGETNAENLKDSTEASFDKLFTMEGKPYGLCTATGEAYALLDDQGLFAPVKREGAKLDTKAWIIPDEQYPESMSLSSFFYQAGYLYYTAASFSQGYQMLAGRISMETGEHKAFACKNISQLIPYEGEKVLAFLYDASAMYSGAVTAEALANAGQYGIFDPAADAVTEPVDLKTNSQYGGFGLSGFCYGNGSLFYKDGSKIIGIDMATGETRNAAYTGGGLYDSIGAGGGTVLYASGYYVTLRNNEMVVYELDSPTLANGALRIFGEFGTETHKTFTQNHPEIPVEVSGQLTNSLEKLTQSMVSENDSYDVLLLILSYMPVDQLIKKGYCSDLSAYPDLVERVNQMYPEYKNAVMADGKLYGVPVDTIGTTFGVNIALWKDLGLTEEELPKTFAELFDFAANWAADYGEDHSDIPLFDYMQADMMLFTLMLNQYMAYTQKKGENLRFDTEVFRKLLDSYKAIDFEELKSVSGSDKNAYFVQNSLFSVSMAVGQYTYRDENMKPLYLSVKEGEEPFVTSNMSLLIINPKTKRMNDAVLYVQNYLDNLPKAGANMMLFPEHNDPVEDPNYTQKKEELEKALADAKGRLEKADAENKASIKEEITGLEEGIKYVEAHRYALTAENIANFREEVAPKMFVQSQNVLMSADETAMGEMNKLLLQYIGGTIDSNKMVQEMDNKMKLMELENQ
ncbi:MAG: ABC transporter substrate-binding protein [Clostridia bacterium]